MNRFSTGNWIKKLMVIAVTGTSMVAFAPVASAVTFSGSGTRGKVYVSTPAVTCSDRMIYVAMSSRMQLNGSNYFGGLIAQGRTRFWHWERRSDGTMGWVRRFSGPIQRVTVPQSSTWVRFGSDSYLQDPSRGYWRVTIDIDWEDPWQGSFVGSTVVNFSNSGDYTGPYRSGWCLY